MNAHQAKRDAQQRRRQLAAIHACAKQLGLDDDSYRALLARVSATCGASVRSAADLNPRQRKAVLEEMRRLGAAAPKGAPARAARAYPGKPANFHRLPEMICKVEAQLADMKLSWAYADAIALRMFGIARVAWCRKEDQLRAIIAALDVEQGKRKAGQFVDHGLAQLGMDEAALVERLGLPASWRRRQEALARAVEAVDALLSAAAEGAAG